MPIEFKKEHAFLRDAVSVEEAEGLLEWLQHEPSAKVDLSACRHLHTANLQVLMAAKPAISRWPEDAKLRAWLEMVFPPSADMENQKPRPPNRRNSRRAAALHKGKVSEVISEIALEPVT